jgi:plastocyanin
VKSKKCTAAFLAAALSILLLLAVSGCSSPSSSGSTGGTTGGGTTGGGGTTVVEKNFQFDPANVTVKVGDTVTFENQDSAAHHVVVGTTDLGEQQPGKSVTWTAEKDGTFPVKCVIHPSMTGQITVGAGGSGAPAGGTQPAPTPPSGTGY